MFLRGILCASLAALSWPALAQSRSEASTPAPSCTVFDASLPDAFTGWRTKTNLQTADGRRSLQGTGIVPGVTYDLALLPTPAVTYVRQPEKPGGSVSYGGMLSLIVARAGTYVVALDGGAWIDVLRGHDPIVSTSHGRGPSCSTIRKMVEFPLSPGRYTIQIAASGTPRLAILIAQKP